MFTVLLYIGRKAVTHLLVSVKSDLIYNILFHQVWQNSIHAASGQVWIFGVFHWKNGFYDEIEWRDNFVLEGKNISIVPRYNRAKFGIHPNSFVCIWERMGYIFLYNQRKHYLKRGKWENCGVSRANVPNKYLATHVAVLDFPIHCRKLMKMPYKDQIDI